MCRNRDTRRREVRRVRLKGKERDRVVGVRRRKRELDSRWDAEDHDVYTTCLGSS
jgi:hypothetical protein